MNLLEGDYNGKNRGKIYELYLKNQYKTKELFDISLKIYENISNYKKEYSIEEENNNKNNAKINIPFKIGLDNDNYETIENKNEEIDEICFDNNKSEKLLKIIKKQIPKNIYYLINKNNTDYDFDTIRQTIIYLYSYYTIKNSSNTKDLLINYKKNLEQLSLYLGKITYIKDYFKQIIYFNYEIRKNILTKDNIKDNIIKYLNNTNIDNVYSKNLKNKILSETHKLEYIKSEKEIQYFYYYLCLLKFSQNYDINLLKELKTELQNEIKFVGNPNTIIPNSIIKLNYKNINTIIIRLKYLLKQNIKSISENFYYILKDLYLTTQDIDNFNDITNDIHNLDKSYNINFRKENKDENEENLDFNSIPTYSLYVILCDLINETDYFIEKK